MNTNQLKQLLENKKIITDTKTPKKDTKPEEIEITFEEIQKNPHKSFVKRVIETKPKKAEIVEDFNNFIKTEENLL